MADTRISAVARPLVVVDDLPEGARLDVAEAFVRFFRPEIEARVLGIAPSTPLVPASGPRRRRATRAAATPV